MPARRVVVELLRSASREAFQVAFSFAARPPVSTMLKPVSTGPGRARRWALGPRFLCRSRSRTARQSDTFSSPYFIPLYTCGSLIWTKVESSADNFRCACTSVRCIIINVLNDIHSVSYLSISMEEPSAILGTTEVPTSTWSVKVLAVAGSVSLSVPNIQCIPNVHIQMQYIFHVK